MTADALGEPVGVRVVDAHVHLWNPRLLRYPWLDSLPALARPFLPSDYESATAGIPIDRMILVEANVVADQTVREAGLFASFAALDARIAGIVAFASLTAPSELDATLEALIAIPKVKGVRHNIQGEAPGFCTQRSFIEGARNVGSRGLTFDLCVTHGQLTDVLELVRACPDTRFILDHCGKPAIRNGFLDPWRADIACLAECANVWCKVSGLATEAKQDDWQDAHLAPYVSHVVERFGTDRVMYGSDWPVLTLAGAYSDWFRFTERFTAAWSDAERRGFYRENAMNAYRL